MQWIGSEARLLALLGTSSLRLLQNPLRQHPPPIRFLSRPRELFRPSPPPPCISSPCRRSSVSGALLSTYPPRSSLAAPTGRPARRESSSTGLRERLSPPLLPPLYCLCYTLSRPIHGPPFPLCEGVRSSPFLQRRDQAVAAPVDAPAAGESQKSIWGLWQ